MNRTPYIPPEALDEYNGVKKPDSPVVPTVAPAAKKPAAKKAAPKKKAK